MRISDGYLESIVYLGFSTPSDGMFLSRVLGTGFLVCHENATYIVTAAHVAVEFMKNKKEQLAIRLNQDQRTGRLVQVEHPKWFFHPNDNIDVAVMPFRLPSWARAETISTDNIISEFKRESKNIGVGDLSYVIGMFSKMEGKKKNVPVVHTGHIASMADEEAVLTEDWRLPPLRKQDGMVEIEGYIVQVQTLRGSSGSPVFVRRSLEMPESEVKAEHDRGTGRSQLGETKVRNWSYGSIWLLGVWHGGWGNVYEFDARNLTRDGKKEWVDLELGTSMGICTPAPRIVEALNLPELRSDRLRTSEV